MSRGKKLDLFIGADLGEGWAKVDEKAHERSAAILEPAKHALSFRREKRRGKTVTLIGPFALTAVQAKTLLKTLKKRLGSGGTLKEEWMEFQGDCSETLRTMLEDEGFRFKR